VLLCREELTAKANMALGGVASSGASSGVTVRVVSKVIRSIRVPRPASETGAGGGGAGLRKDAKGGEKENDGMMLVKYTSQAILTFQNVKGADVLIMGMYVQQYGPDSSPMHQGRAFIECIDSPPVWPTFAGAARKAVLTAVVIGYLEWATSNGFNYVHLHVPPPQDSSNYILVKRSLNFRVRVTMHLSYWFKQVLAQAMSMGLVSNFQSSSSQEQMCFPPGIVEYPASSTTTSPRGNSGNLLVDGVGSSAWQSKHV